MPKGVSGRSDLLAQLGEVFREHGFAGASLAVISRRTGLGKGSLYHLFPGGKEEMVASVLDEIDGWFETAMFRPLREDPDARGAIAGMFRSTDTYFRSGRRLCLVGVLALGDERDRFARQINGYFSAWRDALAGALHRAGGREALARDLADEVVTAIQGALVTARALQDPDLFGRTLRRLEARVSAVIDHTS